MTNLRTLTVAFALCSINADGCGPCPITDETFQILPPSNGDAAPTPDLPKQKGQLSDDECKKRCDGGAVSCSYDEPGGVPTMHCEVIVSCE